MKGPSAESGTTLSRRHSSVAAPSEHAHDVCRRCAAKKRCEVQHTFRNMRSSALSALRIAAESVGALTAARRRWLAVSASGAPCYTTGLAVSARKGSVCAAIKWLEQVNIVFEACLKRRPLESRARSVLFDGKYSIFDVFGRMTTSEHRTH